MIWSLFDYQTKKNSEHIRACLNFYRLVNQRLMNHASNLIFI